MAGPPCPIEPHTSVASRVVELRRLAWKLPSLNNMLSLTPSHSHTCVTPGGGAEASGLAAAQLRKTGDGGERVLQPGAVIGLRGKLRGECVLCTTYGYSVEL